MIELHEVDPATLGLIIEYMYTGASMFVDMSQLISAGVLHMDGENVAAVMGTSGLFGMTHLQHVCIQFLRVHMDSSNAARIVTVADACNVPDLANYARAYIMSHFADVPLDDDWCGLSIDTVLHVLGSDDLCARHEEMVYLAAVAWLSFGDRSPHTHAVLTCVRWHELSHQFIESIVLPSIHMCADRLSFARATAALTHPFTAPHNSRGPPSIVVMGGILPMSSDMPAVARVVGGTWHESPACHIHRRHAACTVLDDGTVFVIGGLVERNFTLEPTSSVEIYRPRTGQWHVGADYPIPITAARASHIGRTVYVTGGASTLQHSLASVYAYDDVTGTWAAVSDQFEGREGTNAEEHDVEVCVAAEHMAQ